VCPSLAARRSGDPLSAISYKRVVAGPPPRYELRLTGSVGGLCPAGRDASPGSTSGCFSWHRSHVRLRSHIFGIVAALLLSPMAGVVATGQTQPRGDQTAGPADRPVPRTDQNSLTAHAELVEKARKGRIDVYFVGDSIIRRWGALDYPELLANWKANFFGWNAANFGWGADRIEHILWRLEDGELDGVRPKIIVVLAGTNNVGSQPGGDEKVADITRGLKALVDLCQRKAPDATLILTAIFPRTDNMAILPEIERVNAYLASLADGKKIRFLNVNDKLADAHGKLFEGMSADGLHPTLKAYQIWADALKPIFTELLGPPAAVDHAPPPTGDPSARGAGIP
jgi:lysophospholipase L1-like esterase